MTLGGASKKWLFAQAPCTVRKGIQGPVFGKNPPHHPPVVILDYMRILKYLKKLESLPNEIRTGHDFFKYQVSPEIQGYFDRGAKKVIICFDRGSPSNKHCESVKRNKHRKPFHLPEDPKKKIISDEEFPLRNDWEALVGNKRATQEIIQYITEKFIASSKETHTSDGFRFVLKPGCTLIIHGGRVGQTKIYSEVKEDGEIEGDPFLRHEPIKTITPKPRLIVLRREEKETIDSDTNKCAFKLHITEEKHDADQLNRLKEGEISVMYFARIFEMEDALIATSDGDLLIMLLMNSQDRIHPITGVFRNQIFLDLKVQGKSDLVYINHMYTSLNDIYRYGGTSCKNVILEICLLLTLPLNDFIRGFSPGVKHCRIQNKDCSTRANAGTRKHFGIDSKTLVKAQFDIAVNKANRIFPNVECPWIVKTYLDNITAYGGFLKSWSLSEISFPPFSDGSTNAPRGFEIDEKKFIRLTERMYLEKYRFTPMGNPTVLNAVEFPKILTVETKDEYHRCEMKGKLETRKFLHNRKDKKNRMMVPRKIRVTSRQLLWLTNYWYNSHRAKCQFPNPNTYYRGLPYFGWKFNKEGHSVPSHIVSVAVSNKIGKCQNDFEKTPHHEFAKRKSFVTRHGRFIVPETNTNAVSTITTPNTTRGCN